MTGSFRIQGLIGSVIGRKASILTNKPRAHLGCAGVPDGHPELKSFLGVPFVELPALAMEEQRHPIDQSALQLDKRVQMECSDIL